MSIFSDLMQEEQNLEQPQVPEITDDDVKAVIEKLPTDPNQLSGVIPTMSDGAYEVESLDVISLEHITQEFPTQDGGTFKLFDDFNFTIKDFAGEGQFISIMGASGSGKSQILRLISGLTKPQQGIVKMYGKPYTDKTSVPMVFQQYSSFPWMSVLDNIMLPLKMKGVPEKDCREKAIEMIRLVGLEGHENKYAQYPTLSGGQLQRVALARNLVFSSQIMLLDEATGALDIFAKRDMQQALLNIYYSAEFDPTIINVTHDVNEAVYLSNRVYILQANPCRVYKVIDIRFDGKRTPAIRESAAFAEYVKQIEAAMDEVNKK